MAKTTDELIEHYASELQKVYDKRTVGDHTFVGLLAAFAWDLSLARSGQPTTVEQKR